MRYSHRAGIGSGNRRHAEPGDESLAHSASTDAASIDHRAAAPVDEPKSSFGERAESDSMVADSHGRSAHASHVPKATWAAVHRRLGWLARRPDPHHGSRSSERPTRPRGSAWATRSVRSVLHSARDPSAGTPAECRASPVRADASAYSVAWRQRALPSANRPVRPVAPLPPEGAMPHREPGRLRHRPETTPAHGARVPCRVGVRTREST